MGEEFGNLRRRAAAVRRGGLVQEAWRLAERDAALGQWPKDWPDDERARWKEDIDRYGDLMEVYRLARRPEELKAPPLWPDALVGIVAGALIAARVAEASETREQVWRAAPDLAVAAFERGARRRAARVRGVTAETAPRVQIAPAVLTAVVTLGLLMTGRLGPRSWEYWLAGRLVQELNERRSWRRAFRA